MMNEQRKTLAQEVNERMRTAIRTEPPSEGDEDAWAIVYDMDTNKPRWFPKELYDEYQRLRFTDIGEP